MMRKPKKRIPRVGIDAEFRPPTKADLENRINSLEQELRSQGAATASAAESYQSYLRLNEDEKQISAYLRLNYAREIANGEHAGLSLPQVVIRYLARERKIGRWRRWWIERRERRQERGRLERKPAELRRTDELRATAPGDIILVDPEGIADALTVLGHNVADNPSTETAVQSMEGDPGSAVIQARTLQVEPSGKVVFRLDTNELRLLRRMIGIWQQSEEPVPREVSDGPQAG